MTKRPVHPFVEKANQSPVYLEQNLRMCEYGWDVNNPGTPGTRCTQSIRRTEQHRMCKNHRPSGNARKGRRR